MLLFFRARHNFKSTVIELFSEKSAFLQQMSAAVRADLLDLPSGQNEHQLLHSKVQLCQDGLTPKVISVILGCSFPSGLEMRSSCKEDVDFPKGTFINTIDDTFYRITTFYLLD